MKNPHDIHLLTPSPYPFFMSQNLQSFAFIIVTWLGNHNLNIYWVQSTIQSIILVVFLWFRDIIRESKEGYHTRKVKDGIIIGFLLFQISEICQFFSQFWSFFHSSLSPSVELSCIWPPIGIIAVDPFSIPLQGTCVLLASGFILTQAHHAFLKGDKITTIFNMILTILFGIFFIILQATEYIYSPFTIADSAFGTCFFMLTGLHGLHVIAGVIFLIVSLFRIIMDQMTIEHNQAYTFSIWYWHLVDVVWIFLYVVIYCWGS